MVRLDVWLDVVCLYKTRSEAQRACKLGQVRVNGVVAKAHREVRVGDEILLQRPMGRRQTIVVKGLADTHRPKAEARTLYDDRTPAPTAEEIEQRRMERIYRATMTPAGRPDKRQRRALRHAQGKE
jgi:ribosome-associated heat shock protein Hsp15